MTQIIGEPIYYVNRLTDVYLTDNEKMSIFGERLKLARIEAGLSQAELADMVGVKQGTVAESEAIGKSSKKTIDYARALKVNPEWLSSGKGKMKIDLQNTSPAPDIKGNVPLISWVQAGSWHEAMDFETPDDLKYLPCLKSHSEFTYALRVRGDSMTASYGKSYPENCIIFVDPELRSPTSGDRIIAKINGDAEVTFKVFMQEGEKKWLKPLNPQHPIITDEFKVLGKIIGKWEDE